MITAPSTLFRYIGRQFIINFLGLMLILLGTLLIFEVIELLRKISSSTPLSLDMVISMSFMRMPYLGERIMPMGILFSAIYTCWKLNKTSELIVIRSYGLSAWQFLSPLIICAFMIGVFSTAILNPVSSVFLGKQQRLEKIYIKKDTNLITITKTGIWLRQPTEGGYALIHSRNFDHTNWQLNDVLILFFDNDDNFLRRIDSPIVSLQDKYWEIKNPVIEDKIKGLISQDAIKLSTELNSQKIEESFADPETISFWSIPEYIKIMDETGFPSTHVSLHFHKLLSTPFLFVAMILLAASFSMRPPRFGGTTYLIAMGVAVGFFVFFAESMLGAFGTSHKIPVYLAAWSTSIMSLLAGISLLLHLEDG